MDEELAKRLADTYQISLDRAQAALILTQGDLLEAARLLEREDPSRERKVGSYSTAVQPDPARAAAPVAAPVPGRAVWDSILRLVKGMFTRPTANHLEVRYPGGGVVDIPLVVALALVCFAFWITALLVVLGWLVGCRFALKGPDVDLPWVNRFLEAVCGARDQLLGSRRPTGKK